MFASKAVFATVSAAICAAYGVDLREPLNPNAPAELQPRTFPCVSVIVTIVLLNVEWICATPDSIVFFTRRLLVVVLRAIVIHYLLCYFFFPAIERLGPFRVRELFFVFCPRTGSPLRCLNPRYDPISVNRFILSETSLRKSPSIV